MFEVNNAVYREMFAGIPEEASKVMDAAWLELGTSCHKIEDLAVTEDAFESPPFAWASSYPNLTSLDLDNVSAYEGTQLASRPQRPFPMRPSYHQLALSTHPRSTGDHTVPVLKAQDRKLGIAWYVGIGPGTEV